MENENIPIYTWLRVPDHIYHSSWDLYTKGPSGCFPSGFSYEKDNAFFSLWGLAPSLSS
ncbi:hypothetical protein ABH958_005563 [Bacillus sp. RC250]